MSKTMKKEELNDLIRSFGIHQIRLDYDGPNELNTLFDRAWVFKTLGIRVKSVRASKTKHGYHIYIDVHNPLTPYEAIFLQCLLGEDYKHSLAGYVQLNNNIPVDEWNLLFERKYYLSRIGDIQQVSEEEYAAELTEKIYTMFTCQKPNSECNIEESAIEDSEEDIIPDNPPFTDKFPADFFDGEKDEEDEPEPEANGKISEELTGRELWDSLSSQEKWERVKQMVSEGKKPLAISIYFGVSYPLASNYVKHCNDEEWVQESVKKARIKKTPKKEPESPKQPTDKLKISYWNELNQAGQMNTIKRIITKKGITEATQIADEIGVESKEIEELMEKNPAFFGLEDQKSIPGKIRELSRRGWKVEEIASELKITRDAVRNVITPPQRIKKSEIMEQMAR